MAAFLVFRAQSVDERLCGPQDDRYQLRRSLAMRNISPKARCRVRGEGAVW
jgi:hypothetical protein